MNLKQKTVSGIRWTSFASIITAAIKLLQVCVLTRYVGQSDFGVLSIALLFISFSDILMDLGITSAVLHKQHITSKQYSSLFWINVMLSLLIFGLLYLLCPYIADYYSDTRLIDILELLSFNILLSGISRLYRTYLQKNLNFRFLSIVESIAYILGLILLVVLAVLGYGIISLIYANLLSSFIVSVCLFIYCQTTKVRFRFYFYYPKVSPFLKIGLYQFASSCLDFFAREIDVVIIAAFYPMEVVGGYTLCKQLILKMYGVLNPILSKVLTPVLSIVQNDRFKIKHVYAKIIELLSFFNYPLYFLIASVSYPLLIILYGTEYSAYYLVLSLVAVTYGINSVASPVGNLEVALGRTDLGFYWTMYRIVTVLVVIYSFRGFPIEIMVFALLMLTILSMIPFSIFLIKKMIGMNIMEYFSLQFPSLVFSLLIMIPLFVTNHLFSGIFTILFYPIIFVVVYLFLQYKFNRALYLYSKINLFSFFRNG